MTSYTNSLQLAKPGVGDPATQNTWGYTTNTDWDLVDTAVSGIQGLTLGPATTVRLQCTPGAPDQSRAAIYVLTGTLTQNVTILLPQNLSRKFAVANNCTGNFSVMLGADNGSGGAAGTTQAILQGVVGEFYSDGTNVYPTTTATGQRITTLGISLAAAASPYIMTQQQAANGNYFFTGALTNNVLVLFPQGYDGDVTIFNGTTGNFQLSVGINNGAGGAAGGTTVIPPGAANVYAFDGANSGNAALVVNAVGVGLLIGTGGVPVGGSSNVSLTYFQATRAAVDFSGTLSGNIDVFWPQGFVGLVSIYNGTAGNFTITIGVSNGAGGFAGGSNIVPQGGANIWNFDGANVGAAVSLQGLTEDSPMAPKAQAIFAGGSWTGTNCTVAAVATGRFNVTIQGGFTFTHGYAACDFYDTVSGKPMTAAAIVDIAGTNPTFELDIYNASGALTNPTSGGFQVIGQ